jgi:hypothetical protein
MTFGPVEGFSDYWRRILCGNSVAFELQIADRLQFLFQQRQIEEAKTKEVTFISIWWSWTIFKTGKWG